MSSYDDRPFFERLVWSFMQVPFIGWLTILAVNSTILRWSSKKFGKFKFSSFLVGLPVTLCLRYTVSDEFLPVFNRHWMNKSPSGRKSIPRYGYVPQDPFPNATPHLSAAPKLGISSAMARVG